MIGLIAFAAIVVALVVIIGLPYPPIVVRPLGQLRPLSE